MTRLFSGFAVLALMLGGHGQARAGMVFGRVYENVRFNQALLANLPAGPASAEFISSDINYRSELQGPTGYTVGGFLKNPNFFNTQPGFRPSDSLGAGTGNTYFYFTSQTFLNAGANSFVVGHDDGAQLEFFGLDGNPADRTLVFDQPNPTAFNTTPFTVMAPRAGFYAFNLAFVESNGPPADLVFQVNGNAVGTVPEPASLTLMGMGLIAFSGYGLRHRRRAVA